MPDPKITHDEVRAVAKLAQLSLSDEEVDALRNDMDAILGYVEKLAELNLDGVAATTHAIPLDMPLREDIVASTLTSDDVLSNAPDQADNMFRVPRIVEGGN